MSLNRKKWGIFYLIIISLSVVSVDMIYAQAAIPQNLIPNQTVEEDEQLIVETLKDHEFTWEIIKAFGVFAYKGYHTQDKIKFKVRNANNSLNSLTVNVSTKSWINATWNNQLLEQNSSFYIIARHWGIAAVNLITSDLAQRFYKHPTMLMYYVTKGGSATVNKTGNEILADYNDQNYFDLNPLQVQAMIESTEIALITTKYIKFETENIWHGANYITVMHIDIDIDADNYNHMTYTLAEGLLLERDTSIKIQNGTGINEPLTGSYKLEIVDFHDFQPAVGIWHWVIWFFIVFGSIMTLIITISVIVNRRQRRLLQMDY
jgi:hypothetical protein